MAEQTIYKLLATADETFRRMPPNVKKLVQDVCHAIPDFGGRKRTIRGPGTEFFEVREFVNGQDEPSRISAKLSAKAGKPMVVEKEAQISQRFYMWRDPSPTMDFSSNPDELLTKKAAAEVMLLAMARHLVKNEDAVGVVDSKGVYRGGSAAPAIANQLYDVRVITGDKAMINTKAPKHSQILLFSDCLESPAVIEDRLRKLRMRNLSGTIVMILDPNEVEYNFDGYVQFEGVQGELKEEFKRAESVRPEYLRNLSDHIEKIRAIAKSTGFDFVFQRTDKPLHEGLMKVYGMTPKDYSPNPVMDLVKKL